MSAHTPGPWHMGGIVNPDGPSATCSVWGPTPKGMQSGEWICRNVSLKNGPIIAAAPDLAEALAWMVKKIDDYPIGLDESNWIRTARAALAKAGVT